MTTHGLEILLRSKWSSSEDKKYIRKMIFQDFQYFSRKNDLRANLRLAGKFLYYISRTSPGHRYLLLRMNYSENLSRTDSSVRFHELLQSVRRKLIKMFDVKSEQILPAPELLLRWNTYSTVISIHKSFSATTLHHNMIFIHDGVSYYKVEVKIVISPNESRHSEKH